MLHFLSSEAKCKSFSPLKIVFSGERKIGFSSLGLLWYFAAQTEYVQAAVGLGFAAMWLRQVKNRVLKCTRKLCHPLVLLFCKNNLRRLLLEQWTPDSLCHVPQGYCSAMRHPAPRGGLEAGCAMPAFTAAPSIPVLPIRAYKCRICVVIPADRENKAQKRPLEIELRRTKGLPIFKHLSY